MLAVEGMAQEGVQRHWFLGIQGKYVRSEQAGLKMAMERVQGWHWLLRMETAWLVAWAAGEGALVAVGTARVSRPEEGGGCISPSSSASPCRAAPLLSSDRSNTLYFQPGGEHFCTVTSEQSLGWCHHLGLAPAVEPGWRSTLRARAWVPRWEGMKARSLLGAYMTLGRAKSSF